jgi:hypothetical protein
MERRRVISVLGAGVVGVPGCTFVGSDPEGASTPTPTRTGTRTPEPTSTESPEPTPEPTPTSEPMPTPRMDSTATAKYQEPDDGKPFVAPPDAYLEVDIGTRMNVEDPKDNRPNGVNLYRAQSVEAVYEVQIVDTRADKIRHHSLYRVPADRQLALILNDPSDYAVNIYDHDRGQGWTLAIGRGYFDCNHRSHWGYSLEGSGFRWNIHQTMRGCDA